MSIRIVGLSLALGVTALALPQGASAQPRIEDGVFRLDRNQRNDCANARRAGDPVPWWCGGREATPAPPFDLACTDREWVGLELANKACPDAPSPSGIWHLDRPFTLSQNPHLQRLCHYTWQPLGPNNPPPDVAALPDDPRIRLERDCDVVTGHAVPVIAADALFSAWQAQVEAPDWDLAAPFAATPVRVAVVDGGFGGVSYPGGPGQAAVAHPVAISSVVRALACPERGDGAFCAAGTPNYNAMPYISRGSTGALGGYFGTQVGYADAVAQAVDEWRLDSTPERPAHLIINLSLGWDPGYDVSAAQRVAGAAALWATRYAACQGALLIAAAGNQADGEDVGPLYPAAYEQMPRDCGEPAPQGVYQPLVHAVGGVDGRDRPLAVSRPGGTPRLVAPAAMVVVPEDTLVGVDRPTEVLTGTSMAAAAASGSAALLWSLRPGLHGDTIMELLHQSGELMGPPAEFGLPNALQPQRRLAISRAFQLACPDGQIIGACPAAASRPALAPARPLNDDARLPFADLVAWLFQNPTPGAEAINPPPPPASRSSYVDVWSVPQPGTPNCPTCGLLDNKLYGELDPNLSGTYIGNPELKYKDEFGDINTIYLDPLPEPGAFVVDLNDKLANKTVISAWLEIPAKIAGEIVTTSSQLDVD